MNLRAYAGLFGRLLSYHSLGKAVSLVAAAYAMRCLGPDKIGLASTYLSFLAAGSVLVHLGWESALVRDHRALATEEEKARFIQQVSRLRGLLFALLMAVAAGSFVVSGSVHPGLFALCAAVVACDALSLSWLLQSKEQHDLNLRLRLVQQLLGAALIFAFFRPGQALGSDLAVRAASGGAVLLWTLWRFGALGSALAPLKETLRFAASYARTNAALTVLALCAYLGSQFNEGILGYANSTHALGVYRAASTAAGVLEEAATLVMLVVYPRMLSWHDRGGGLLWRRQLQLSFATLGAAALTCAGAWVLGPLAFRLVFGPEYAGASGPFVILAATKFAILIKTYFYFALMAQRRDRILLAVTVPLTLAGCLANYALVQSYGAYGTSFVNLGIQVLLACGFVAFSRQEQVAERHA